MSTDDIVFLTFVWILVSAILNGVVSLAILAYVPNPWKLPRWFSAETEATWRVLWTGVSYTLLFLVGPLGCVWALYREKHKDALEEVMKERLSGPVETERGQLSLRE